MARRIESMPTWDPLEWPQGQPLFEVQWRALSEGLAGNGLVNASDCTITATATDLQIEVADGSVRYNQTEYALGGAETHALSPGDASNDRWDTVYFNTSGPATGVREGTPGASPEPPDIQGDEVLLGVVYVPQGASDVLGSNVLNWRSAPAGGGTAADVTYDDATGQFGAGTVNDALDELQEAAQISAHPIANGDLANSAITINTTGGISATDNQVDLGGSTELSVETFDADQFDRTDRGTVSTGSQEPAWFTSLADQETVEVAQAGLLKQNLGAAPSGLDLVLYTGTGGTFTKQATLVTGDGTVQDEVAGSPLASYQNTSGGAQTVAIGVDNGKFNSGSGSSRNYVATFVGQVV